MMLRETMEFGSMKVSMLCRVGLYIELSFVTFVFSGGPQYEISDFL